MGRIRYLISQAAGVYNAARIISAEMVGEAHAILNAECHGGVMMPPTAADALMR